MQCADWWKNMVASFFLCRRTVLCFVIVLSFLSLRVSCTDFTIDWTPEGVRGYNSSHPLVVELADRLLFSCPRTGSFTYSNIWIQTHQQQYDSCDCAAIPDDSSEGDQSCDPDVLKNGQCVNGLNFRPTLTIRKFDIDLDNVVNFVPGRRYYLASYARDNSLQAAFSDNLRGGQCLSGLRMVVEVMALPTTPPATETTDADYATTSSLPDSSGSSGGGGGGGSGDPSGDGSRDGDDNAGVGSSAGSGNDGDGKTDEISDKFTTKPEESLPSVDLLASVAIRDWHISVIVILGVAIVSLVGVALPLAIVGVFFYRRRKSRDFAINPEDAPISTTPTTSTPTSTDRKSVV